MISKVKGLVIYVILKNSRPTKTRIFLVLESSIHKHILNQFKVPLMTNLNIDEELWQLINSILVDKKVKISRPNRKTISQTILTYL